MGVVRVYVSISFILFYSLFLITALVWRKSEEGGIFRKGNPSVFYFESFLKKLDISAVACVRVVMGIYLATIKLKKSGKCKGFKRLGTFCTVYWQ